MFTPKGKFGWYELMTSDTNAAGKFYSDVVGWTTKEVSSGDSHPYTTFNIGDVGVAGMLHIPGHTAWVGYIAVDDVDAHYERVKAAGAHIVFAPEDTDWGSRRYRVLDPEGYEWSFGNYRPAMPAETV